MATPSEYDEAQRRTHRLLAVYLLLQAWRKQADCVAIDRWDLLPFISAKKMTGDRLARLRNDVSDIFPYCENTTETGSGTYRAIYLSRFEIPREAFAGADSEMKRSERLTAAGLRTIIVERLPTEEEVIKDLAFLSHGIGTVSDA